MTRAIRWIASIVYTLSLVFVAVSTLDPRFGGAFEFAARMLALTVSMGIIVSLTYLHERMHPPEPKRKARRDQPAL